ncbi:YoaK family protein [Streptomyces zaomyceticus]|uniref:YoaK family protein n=1 Tax=Streptomyces zaomyceticus TaxID=68286 RepID=UPI00370F7CBE
MRKLLADAAHTLVPPRGGRHGPLPPLLLALTVVTGLVDAVSYLGLGEVFVANMTGNVVLLGFALAGTAGLSAPATAVSTAAFLAGAVAGGRFGGRFAGHRGRLLASAMSVQAVLVTAALVTATLADDGPAAPVRYTLIVLLGLAMGLQNAVVRRLGVPDLTTTVVTQTLTGLASDSTPNPAPHSGPASAAPGLADDSTPDGGAGLRRGRRVLSVLAILLGALVGALLLRVSLTLVLGVALALLAAAALVTRRLSATDAAWVRP